MDLRASPPNANNRLNVSVVLATYRPGYRSHIYDMGSEPNFRITFGTVIENLKVRAVSVRRSSEIHEEIFLWLDHIELALSTFLDFVEQMLVAC